MEIYYIDGHNLALEMVSRINKDEDAKVPLAEEAAKKCRSTRDQIERWMEKDAPVVYGVNTGLGNLKDVVVPPEKHIEWNKTLPYPHAAGMGEYLPSEVTRISLLLRANVIARAYSGVRPELIDRILSIYNAGVAPAVHSEGSTGLSDLGPLAQNVMTVAGLPDAKAYYKGELMPSRDAFRKAGLDETFTLECKEVLAQMNGSTMTQAIAVLAFLRFEELLPELLTEKKDCGEALRAQKRACAQVVDFARKILEKENNISSDNPLLFETGEENYEAVMGCNCSNTQVGYAMDMMSTIIAELAGEVQDDGWSELRKAKADFLINKTKTCAMQVSADSIPTKGGQEDHVEFNYTAASKFDYAVSLAGKLLAV